MNSAPPRLPFLPLAIPVTAVHSCQSLPNEASHPDGVFVKKTYGLTAFRRPGCVT